MYKFPKHLATLASQSGTLLSKVKNGLREKGMTLLELVIVIAIIGILAAISVPYYYSYIDRARYVRVIENLRLIDLECIAFHIQFDRYPNTLAEIGLGGMTDPWENPYQYLNIATATGNGKLRKDHNNVPVNNDFDLYSMGRDGKSVSPFTAKASRDDIVRANDGNFFGRVSDY